jgi:type II secretory pathway component PulF
VSVRYLEVPGGQHAFDALASPRTRAATAAITTFCEELALLLEAGVPMISALGILADRSNNPALARMIREMADSIEGGSSFSEAAEEHSRRFGKLFIAMFKAGDESGTLVQALRRVSERGERMVEVRHRAIAVLIYPVIIILVAIVVISIAFSIAMSAIRPLLQDVQTEVPWTMDVLLKLGQAWRSTGFWIGAVLVVIGLVIAYKLAMRFSAVRLLRDRLLVRAPVIGCFVKQNLVANFARVFGTMLRAGVPLQEGLEAAQENTRNELLKLTITRTQETVREGGRLGPALQRERIFPPLAHDLIEVGEETGALDEVFERMADIYEKKSSRETEILAKFIHPLVVIFLALVVGFIVIAMFHTYSRLMVELSAG